MHGSIHSRRQFLKASAGAATLAMTAASYARIRGANERISIGLIGCGDRGCGAHMAGIHKFDKEQNVEFTAVCDPWRLARERASGLANDWYGRPARQFVSYKDLLALDDVDAVMIASCDHQHTTHLEAAATAKKDIYVEKPMAKDLAKLNRAVDAVKAAGVVVQVGTQLRSFPSFAGCREVYRSGILGKVGRIEQCRNGTRPYWYQYMKDVKKEDVDWKEFLMDAPEQPFHPVRYSGWYGYRDFSDGPVPGLASHFIDLVHFITGATYPTNCVSLGGTYTWKDEHKFTCPDHVQALWSYPDGFLVSYGTNFGNGGGNSFKAFGDVGTLDMVNWHLPVLTADGGSKDRGAIRGSKPVSEVPMPDHFLNWLQCLRTRQTPNASIDAGHQHSIAAIMAVRAFDTGQRQIYDPTKREIREG